MENNLKSLVSHEFSKKYGVDNYLRISNFDDYSEDKLIPELRRQEQIRFIQDLISSIQKDISQSISKKEYIAHYIMNYEYIPLWVLINALSLGRISKFYSLMKQKNRIQVAKFWGIKENDLTQYIKLLAFYRNLCAHDERIYNAKTGKTCNIPDNVYHQKLNIPKVNNRYAYGKNDLYALLITLKVLLNEQDFNTLFNKIHGRIYSINSKIKYITLRNIYEKMGFPDNWYSIRKS